MKRDLLSYKSALFFSSGITVMIHLFFIIIFFFGRDALLPPDAPARHTPGLDIQHLFFSLLANFLYIFALFVLNFRVLKSNLKRKLLFIILGTVFIDVTANFTILMFQSHLFSLEGLPPVRAIIGRLLGDSFIALIVVFSAQIIYLTKKQQDAELKNKELTAENIQSRYESLKNQMDPHFLFNTLSSLNSMIEIDPGKAQEYVIQLSNVFRYTLQNRETVRLEEELKFTKDYCDLMQIRYGEHLSFIFDIQPEYLNYLIAPLGIQTLIENAIKHNVISKKNPLQVKIETTNEACIKISNPIRKKLNPETGGGIGLTNLSERYRLKWGREIYVSNKDEIFQVIIPLIAPSKQ